MRIPKAVVAVAVILGVSGLAIAGSGKKNPGEKPNAKAKKVFHVVAFKFKEGVSQTQIENVCRDFKALKKKVPEILSYKAGVNNSPEGLHKGFTHCFILTFKDTKARDTYLPHPAHKEFGKGLGGLIADVFVIDFEG
jgi:hypothetical protein